MRSNSIKLGSFWKRVSGPKTDRYGETVEVINKVYASLNPVIAIKSNRGYIEYVLIGDFYKDFIPLVNIKTVIALLESYFNKMRVKF